MGQYRLLAREVDDILEDLQIWRARAEKITTSYSDLPKGMVGGDRIQTSVEIIEELEHKADAKILELYSLKKEIDGAIDSVPNRELRSLLRYRYIQDKRWDDISQKMHYDIDGKNIYKRHRKALNLIKMDT